MPPWPRCMPPIFAHPQFRPNFQHDFLAKMTSGVEKGCRNSKNHLRRHLYIPIITHC